MENVQPIIAAQFNGFLQMYEQKYKQQAAQAKRFEEELENARSLEYLNSLCEALESMLKEWYFLSGLHDVKSQNARLRKYLEA